MADIIRDAIPSRINITAPVFSSAARFIILARGITRGTTVRRLTRTRCIRVALITGVTLTTAMLTPAPLRFIHIPDVRAVVITAGLAAADTKTSVGRLHNQRTQTRGRVIDRFSSGCALG